MEPVKKKKKSEGHQADTAMGLLKAITSPISTVSKPSKKPEKSLSAFSSASYPPLYSEIRKEHKKKASSAEHEETPEEGDFHKAKKMKPIFVNTDTVTVREAEGLKMKLLLSPKDKSGTDDEAFNFATSSSLKKSSKKMSREQDHATFHSAIEAQSLPKTVVRKKHKSESRASESFDSETRFYSEVRAGNLSECDLSGLDALDTASSSGGELEAGELVIDDSFREMKKKKKKDKKSKKKKDKEKHREKKHSKSKKMHAHSPAKILATTKCCYPTQSAVSTPYAINVPPPSIFHMEGQSEKKKKKEEKDKEKVEKPEKKKKNMSAYQLFCKEYRINIVAEHPGIAKTMMQNSDYRHFDFVTSFNGIDVLEHPELRIEKLRYVFRSLQHVIDDNKPLAKIIPVPPLFAFKQLPNLKQTIIHSKLPSFQDNIDHNATQPCQPRQLLQN
eukprot:g48499.t1